jgi:hypothetical protein
MHLHDGNGVLVDTLDLVTLGASMFVDVGSTWYLDGTLGA